MMEVGEALALVLRLCMTFEGLVLHPYLDAVSVPTIGYGSTEYLDGRRVTLKDPPITREHAIVLLRTRVLRDFMPGVRRLAGAIDTPGRLAALTDLAYNIGLGNLRASTLIRLVRAGRWSEAPAQFRRWNKAGGRVLAGLMKRREAEVLLL